MHLNAPHYKLRINTYLQLITPDNVYIQLYLKLYCTFNMSTFRHPTVYSTLYFGELPDGYEADCNWCTFNKVTAENRCWIPVPKKNVVHQTCATGERQLEKAGLFHHWSCAMSFCWYRRGMQRYMDQVRKEAGKHGYHGRIIPLAPDPIRRLKNFEPRVQGTVKSSRQRFNQCIEDGIEVKELHNSEISSARIHRLCKKKKEALEPIEAIHVFEHSTPDAPDLREVVASIETVTKGQPERHSGAYEEYHNSKSRECNTKTSKKTQASLQNGKISKSTRTKTQLKRSTHRSTIRIKPIF